MEREMWRERERDGEREREREKSGDREEREGGGKEVTGKEGRGRRDLEEGRVSGGIVHHPHANQFARHEDRHACHIRNPGGEHLPEPLLIVCCLFSP